MSAEIADFRVVHLASILDFSSAELIAEVCETFSHWNTKFSASFLLSTASRRFLSSQHTAQLLDSLVDVVLGHICGRSDSDILLLACAEVLSGNMNDTVLVDIESNFDLRDTSGSRSDTVETESTELLVVSCELTLTLEDVDVNSRLVVSVG